MITMDNEAARLLMLQPCKSPAEDRHVAFVKDCSPQRPSKASVDGEFFVTHLLIWEIIAGGIW
jgi:hypothetical protein